MRLSLRTACRAATAYLLGALLVCGCDRGGARSGQIGQIAPEFAVDDGSKTVDLAKLRGRVVVLNFWATWCAPCVQEMPSLEALQHALPAVQIVAVSTDIDADAYTTFLRRHDLAVLSVRDGAQKSNTLYKSFAFPETYIIDKNGVIRRKFIGPQDFNSPEIVDFLKKLAA